MITVTLPHRGVDDWGDGEYQAPRGDRKHKGIDYECPVGAVIHSNVTGRVTKVGYPYSDDLSFRYVEVTDTDQQRHRYFYVYPLVNKGDAVDEGDSLGLSQDISGRYSDPDKKPMKNHVHYEVLTEHGPINPELA